MKTRRVLTIIVSVLFVSVLAVTSLSVLMSMNSRADSGSSAAAAPRFPISLGTAKVDFAAGAYPVDATELALVLQSGETAKLEDFTRLTSVDFSGSTCYEEIIAWAEKHPDVALRYTVTLPDGQVVDNEVQSLDLSAMDGESLRRTAELLPYLPQLKSIELGGRSAADAIGSEALTALQEIRPDVSVSYAIRLLGQDYPLDTTSLDLSGISSGEIDEAVAVLASLPNVDSITLGSEGGGLSWGDIDRIHAARPEAALDYAFTLWGQSLNLADESVSFWHVRMDDQGAAVRQVLPYMTRLNYLDMDSCGVSNENMDAIRQAFPQVNVVWRVWFGLNYSVRTDEERILASKPSVGGVVNDADAAVLKYCNGCKYLDLGHNEDLTNIDFVRGMPNLQVAVIAMNPITSLEPLASCTHLEYLETQTTAVSDLSPLSGLTELRHLNICNLKNLYDLSPIYNLTGLTRLYIGCVTPIPEDQVAHMRELAPDCEIDTEVYDPTSGHWRIALTIEGPDWVKTIPAPRYELLRKQFGYSDSDFSFTWNDPLY